MHGRNFKGGWLKNWSISVYFAQCLTNNATSNQRPYKKLLNYCIPLVKVTRKTKWFVKNKNTTRKD